MFSLHLQWPWQQVCETKITTHYEESYQLVHTNMKFTKIQANGKLVCFSIQCNLSTISSNTGTLQQQQKGVLVQL